MTIEPMHSLVIDVRGNGHDIAVDPTATLTGRLRVKDDGGPVRVRIGACVTGKWDITVSRGGTLLVGERTTCETAVVAAQSTTLAIGSDCMLSFGIEIRTTDTHAIYDVATGERVNDDKPVAIGDHVWLAKQAVVLKGTTIGAGAVVGTRSVVSGEVPPLALCAGVPARVLRTGVTWTRKVGKGRLADDADAMAIVAAYADC